MADAAVALEAVKAGGAAPKGVTLPSNRKSEFAASVLVSTPVVSIAYAKGFESPPAADPVPANVSAPGS